MKKTIIRLMWKTSTGEIDWAENSADLDAMFEMLKETNSEFKAIIIYNITV